MRTTRPLVFVLFLVFASSTLSQQQPTSPVRATMDAQSVALIPKVLAALNGTVAVTDVTLTGTATRTSGSDTETGPITLKALGPYDSRVDLVTGSGTYTEVRSAVPPGAPQGYTVGLDGVKHKIAGHNTQTDAAWFFPVFSSLIKTSNPQLTISYVGTEVKDGTSLAHLHFICRFPPPAPALTAKLPKNFVSHAEQLTAVDVYIDPSSYLPSVLAFNTHPDNNALIDIPVEIHFTDYQKSANGVEVPLHIQKLVNGTLYLDVTIQSANVNTGLSATEFTE